MVPALPVANVGARRYRAGMTLRHALTGGTMLLALAASLATTPVPAVQDGAVADPPLPMWSATAGLEDPAVILLEDGDSLTVPLTLAITLPEAPGDWTEQFVVTVPVDSASTGGVTVELWGDGDVPLDVDGPVAPAEEARVTADDLLADCAPGLPCSVDVVGVFAATGGHALITWKAEYEAEALEQGDDSQSVPARVVRTEGG